MRHPLENIKEVLLASKNYTANSLQAIKLNKAITYFVANNAQPFQYSPVDVTQNRVNLKNMKKADFGVVRKPIFVE